MTAATVTYIANGKVWTDSKKLAEAFAEPGKPSRHDNILRKIKGILAETPNDFQQLNFEFVEIVEKNAIGGETDSSYYRMTRDGFFHIALTFTGKKGNAFRVVVIEEFSRMEKELLEAGLRKKPTSLADLLDQAAAEIRAEAARADKAEAKVTELSTKLDQNRDVKSLLAWIAEFPQIGAVHANTAIARLKKLAKTMGIEIRKIPDQRFGTANIYPRNLIEAYLAAYPA